MIHKFGYNISPHGDKRTRICLVNLEVNPITTDKKSSSICTVQQFTGLFY